MITIRPATPADEPALGRYGAGLMRQHHAVDPRRFIETANPEAGYGRFLVSRIGDPESLLLVAEDAGRVVGYIYADVEGTSWMDLRGPCGVIQDVFVDETARRLGAGKELVRAAIDWIYSQGRTQVVLHTMAMNTPAQHLFMSFGFRPTMLEMTLDRESGEGKHDG